MKKYLVFSFAAMIGNFTTQVGGIEFEFLTQHVIKLHGFQVYVMNDGVKVRFHMQINSEGTFFITDPGSCEGIPVL